MGITQKHRDVAILTPLGEDVLLIRQLEAREELGGQFTLDMNLISQDVKIAPEDIVGKGVCVRLEYDGGTRYFNGFVREFACVTVGQKYSEYCLEAVPWTWFLSQNRDSRIFQNLSVPEIIETVFKDRGLTDFENELTESYDTLEYCVQYGESDYAFVHRLIEKNGIYYYFRHEIDKHILVLCDSANVHSAFPSYDKIEFKPHNDKEQREVITKWLVKTRVQANRVSVKDFDFKNSRSDLSAMSVAETSYYDGNLDVFDYSPGYKTVAQGEQFARKRTGLLKSASQSCEGETLARGLRPGYVFEMYAHPHEDQNKQFLTTSSLCKIEVGGYETGEKKGESNVSFTCGFEAISADVRFFLTLRTPEPRIEGPQTAFVTGPSGEEIYTDEHGRVKVVFHWDRYGTADENSSCWVRVSQGLAGNKWGMINLPRIGQEVIVEFEGGNPDRPIITGRVYNGQSPVPYKLPANKTISTAKSSSSKGGKGFNEIRFEDKDGKEQVLVHVQRDKDEYVEHDSFRTIRKDFHDTVRKNKYDRVKKNLYEKISLDHVKSVGGNSNTTVVGESVESVTKGTSFHVGEKFQVNAAEIVSETPGKVSVKANEQILESAAKISLKAGEICLEGSTAVCLKVGGSVVSVSSAGVCINGSVVKLNSGATALGSGTAASYVTPALLSPKSAVYANDGSPGSVGKEKDLSNLEPDIIQLVAQKAPPFIPHPNTVVGFVPGVEPPLAGVLPLLPAVTNGGYLQCGHGRNSGQEGILQVVATRCTSLEPLTIGGADATKGNYSGILASNPSSSFKKLVQNAANNRVSSVNATYDKFNKLANVTKWLPKVEFKVSDGRYDVVTALVGQKTCGAKAQIVPSPQTPLDNKMKAVPVSQQIVPSPFYGGTPSSIYSKLDFNAAVEHYKWLGTNCFQRHLVHFAMLNGSVGKCEIHSYPATKGEIKISTDFITQLVNKLNDAFFMPLEKLLSYGPCSCEFGIEVATGFVSFEYGWEEEENNWMCYFQRKIEAGLDPLFGINISGKVSLLALAGLYFAIPTALTKFLGKAIADIIIFLNISLKLILKGGSVFKTYYLPCQRTVTQGNLTAAFAVPVEIGVEARFGSEYIASVSVAGAFESSFDCEVPLVLENQSIGFKTELTWGPIEGKVTFKATALWIFKREKTNKHVFSEKKDLYKSDGLTKIWPLSDGSGGGAR